VLLRESLCEICPSSFSGSSLRLLIDFLRVGKFMVNEFFNLADTFSITVVALAGIFIVLGAIENSIGL
jgi:hypothetical protein